ncbi:MAG: acyl carrier protein [Oscillospiraceae bacterium]|nr:acyl carrier protein [Oscillospiraceae bacterium]
MTEKLKDIIIEFVDADKDNIKPESRFIEDLGFNSYDFMSFLGAVEDAFGVEAEESEVIKLRTVGEVVEYIKSIKKS